MKMPSETLKKKKVLFISVDGVQNYMDSLFLPVIGGIKRRGVDIDVLNFCMKDKNLRDRILDSAKKNNIRVFFGNYTNKPPIAGTLYMLLAGSFKIFKICNKGKYDVVMPRSLLGGIFALILKKFSKVEIVYESDGLMLDERLEFGGWKRNGILHKVFQKIEKSLVLKSNYIIVRTNHTKALLIERYNIAYPENLIVIPNGKDSFLYKPISPNSKLKCREKYSLNVEDKILVYIGSLGKQYMPELILKIFSEANKKILNLKLLLLTPNIIEANELIKTNCSEDVSQSIIVDCVPFNEIPSLLSSSDIGLAIRYPSKSQMAVCPLKVIEYMLCALPVITNRNIGDLDGYNWFDKIGYVIDDVEDVDFNALTCFINETKVDEYISNRTIAIEYFSIDSAVSRYCRILDDKVL